MAQQNKDNAVQDYLKMIRKSWTYDRLTEEERKQFEKRVQMSSYEGRMLIKGSYRDRWSLCAAMYDMFLAGTGFWDIDNPYINWRRENN